MRRDIYVDLLRWKESPNRKPLVLKGARQVGKTHILREFGKAEFEAVCYLNFEEDGRLANIFEKDLRPQQILQQLSFIADQPIQSTTLIIFDEVQKAPRALTALKYFAEEQPDQCIAAAGSLLGIKVAVPSAFPIGKVDLMEMYPMTFFEFLTAMGKDKYRLALQNIEENQEVCHSLHEDLLTNLRTYYLIGGMPEVVKTYREGLNWPGAKQLQENIAQAYIMDFARHAPGSDIPKISKIWDSIPKFLAKENKKFIFGALAVGARSRTYEDAVAWLEDMGLVYRSRGVSTPKLPLSAYHKINAFKIFMLDIGLLRAVTKLDPKTIEKNEDLAKVFHGAFVENYVAQQLAASRTDSFYWDGNTSNNEIDFLLSSYDSVLPLEIKSGYNTKSKSLQAYQNRFEPAIAIKASLNPYSRNSNHINLPLYAINALPNILADRT